MRIAISGTHFSGKSTLVSSLLKQLPSYVSVGEPYHLLEEEGYGFSDPPSVEDFEQQLNRYRRLGTYDGICHSATRFDCFCSNRRPKPHSCTHA